MTHGLQRCDTGKHDYQPRYDEKAPPAGSGDWMVGALASKDKIYVCDICVKCGNKISHR